MADDSIQTGPKWHTPEILERRKEAARPYVGAVGELEQLHEEGKITLLPQGRRVLLRAVLATDVSDLSAGVAYDARQAVAHEIVAFGPGCLEWWTKEGIPADQRPRVGQHCFVLSGCLDRASKTDRTCRLWSCKVDDIAAVWDV